MKFGAHVSIAGGFPSAVERAVESGCEAFQVFTKSANQWRARSLEESEARGFRDAWRSGGFDAPIGHVSYLVNLGSPDDAVWSRSIEAFGDELDRSERLGLAALVTHPGCHMGAGEDAGLRRIAEGINRVLERRAEQRVLIALENTAGQGSSLGKSFGEIRRIIDLVEQPDRMAVCIDTCHAHVSGHDLSNREGVRKMVREFDDTVGIARLVALHVNDSKRETGSRVDRHAHVGAGTIGLEGFFHLLHCRALRRLPCLLETPKEGDMDRTNLAVLRALASAPACQEAVRAASAARRRWARRKPSPRPPQLPFGRPRR